MELTVRHLGDKGTIIFSKKEIPHFLPDTGRFTLISAPEGIQAAFRSLEGIAT